VQKHNFLLSSADRHHVFIFFQHQVHSLNSSPIVGLKLFSLDIQPLCPVQGTAADGFKITLINLHDQIGGKDARIVHILHDEVIVEARTDIAESVAVMVKNCMEKAFNDILPEVQFVVEPEIRDSWG
jgi:hypothetical protein